MYIRGVTILFFLLISSCGRVQAGAWTQPDGGYFLKIAPSYLSTSREFNHEGKRQAIQEEQFASEDASFRDFSLFAYAEYGLRERFTLIARFPFKILRLERQLLIGGGRLRQLERLYTAGFGDLTLSLRSALLDGSLAVSVQTGLKIPLGYDRTPDDDGPPLGSGKADAEAHLLLGRSLYPLPAYLSAGIGYRRRGGRLHDEILYAVEVGYTVASLLLKIAVDGVQNRSTPLDIAGRTVVTPLPGGGGALPDLLVGDQHVTKLNPAVAYSLRSGLALQAEVLYTIAATNSLSGTIFSLGLLLTDR